MRSTRVVAIAAVCVLAGIVAGAVALVATAPGAPAIVPSHLVVGQGPPTTATGVLTYSDSTGITARADCAIDFASSAVDVTASASLSVVTVNLEARLVDRVVFLYLAQFATLVGEPWVTTGRARSTDKLDELATVLRHPDLAKLHPTARRVTTTSNGTTTTRMAFGLVHVPFADSLPIPIPDPAHLTLVVVTGPQGQLLATSARLANPSERAGLSFVVTGYDVPVSIAAPPADQVTTLTPRRAAELFGTDAPTVDRLLRGLRRVAG